MNPLSALAAACAALLIARCAPSAAPPEAVETRAVGPGFVGGEASGRSRGAVVRFAGMIEERNGEVFACVAIAHNEAPSSKVAAAELRVALRFHVGEEKLNRALRFAAVYPNDLSIRGKQANCAPLGLPWEARYADEPLTLRFRRLRI